MSFFDRLPDQILNHILLISSQHFLSFYPIPSKFSPESIPSVEARQVSVPLPRFLEEVYSKFDSDTIFVKNGWVFYSEKSIKSHSIQFSISEKKELFDIAFKGIGTGHFNVLIYDSETGKVFVDVDGGDSSRLLNFNHKRRRSSSPSDFIQLSFEAWEAHTDSAEV